ncbi:type 1 glutamine amidotransferase [Planctomycetota bacterium]|nr:type 1 glutamine amidotransferase [Planctomycetota bacterium]
MAILIVQHHEAEKPGRIGEVLQENSLELKVVKLYAGEELPTDYGDIDGVVILGGPMNVDQIDEHPYLACEIALVKWVHKQGLPILGVCLGAQLIAKALGGAVGKMQKTEVGFEDVELSPIGKMDAMLYGLPWRTKQFHTHGYEVTKLPTEGQVMAGSAMCKHQMFCVGMRCWGVQYHFEWTKRDLLNIVDQFGSWIKEGGHDLNAIKADIEEHYDLYRHLGDRLCERLALLLFSVEARVDRPRWQAANYNSWE